MEFDLVLDPDAPLPWIEINEGSLDLIASVSNRNEDSLDPIPSVSNRNVDSLDPIPSVSNRNIAIKLNVSGKFFQTSLLTLTQYSESGLAKAIVDRDHGMKTEEDHYFFDVNPDHFQIVLDWLRSRGITTNDVNLLKEAMKVANGFGLKELEAELMEKWKNIDLKKISYPAMIHLHFRPEAPRLAN